MGSSLTAKGNVQRPKGSNLIAKGSILQRKAIYCKGKWANRSSLIAKNSIL